MCDKTRYIPCPFCKEIVQVKPDTEALAAINEARGQGRREAVQGTIEYLYGTPWKNILATLPKVGGCEMCKGTGFIKAAPTKQPERCPRCSSKK